MWFSTIDRSDGLSMSCYISARKSHKNGQPADHMTEYLRHIWTMPNAKTSEQGMYELFSTQIHLCIQSCLILFGSFHHLCFNRLRQLRRLFPWRLLWLFSIPIQRIDLLPDFPPRPFTVMVWCHHLQGKFKKPGVVEDCGSTRLVSVFTE